MLSEFAINLSSQRIWDFPRGISTPLETYRRKLYTLTLLAYYLSLNVFF